jgi:hypothetical protein
MTGSSQHDASASKRASPAYRDAKVANRTFGIGWEIAHAAVSRRPPISFSLSLSLFSLYTYAAKVWDVLVQGAFRPVATLASLNAGDA